MLRSCKSCETAAKIPSQVEYTIGSVNHASEIVESSNLDVEFSMWMEKETTTYGVNHETLDMAYANRCMLVGKNESFQSTTPKLSSMVLWSG